MQFTVIHWGIVLAERCVTHQSVPPSEKEVAHTNQAMPTACVSLSIHTPIQPVRLLIILTGFHSAVRLCNSTSQRYTHLGSAFHESKETTGESPIQIVLEDCSTRSQLLSQRISFCVRSPAWRSKTRSPPTSPQWC